MNTKTTKTIERGTLQVVSCFLVYQNMFVEIDLWK